MCELKPATIHLSGEFLFFFFSHLLGHFVYHGLSYFRWHEMVSGSTRSDVTKTFNDRKDSVLPCATFRRLIFLLIYIILLIYLLIYEALLPSSLCHWLVPFSSSRISWVYQQTLTVSKNCRRIWISVSCESVCTLE